MWVVFDRMGLSRIFKYLTSFVFSFFCLFGLFEIAACSDNEDEGQNDGTLITITNGGDSDLNTYLQDVEGKVNVKVSGFANITQDVLKNALGTTDTQSITIDGGKTGAKIYIKGSGNEAPLFAKGSALLTFRNIEIVDQTTAKVWWQNWSTEFTGNLLFENCIIQDGILIDHGANAMFKNCKITSQAPSRYAFWLHGGTAVLQNCKISGTYGIKVHEEPGSKIINLTIEDCQFGPLTKRPALAFEKINAQAVIEVRGCTFTNCGKWYDRPSVIDEGINGFYEATKVTTDEYTFIYENNTVDGIPCSELTKEYDDNYIID